METIKVNTDDLGEFLKLAVKYGEYMKSPYLIDASQTMHDLFFGEEPIMTGFEEWAKGQIKFENK